VASVADRRANGFLIGGEMFGMEDGAVVECDSPGATGTVPATGDAGMISSSNEAAKAHASAAV
jgi:hypothetical protein